MDTTAHVTGPLFIFSNHEVLNASVARGLRLSETDADHDLSYRFMRQTSSG